MDTTDSHGNGVGGGEILDWLFGGSSKSNGRMDDSLIMQFKLLPYVKILIFIALLFIMCYLILKIFHIKSPFKGKGMMAELKHMESVKKRDASILRANRMMNWVTNFIEKTPFAINVTLIEYWQYNLTRANVRVPGGHRIIKAVEFNAIIKFCVMCCCAVAVVCAVFANTLLGFGLFVGSICLGNFLPMEFVRSTVRTKDMEVKENFVDLYLMLHYVLLANVKTPLADTMKSYLKTTNSKEMERFVDTCVHYMETYEEDTAAGYIAKEYREIPEVGKLMRLIKQAHAGGDTQQELIGFRDELLAAREYVWTRRRDKVVAKAQASFNLLYPVLIQAIISAASIYFSDLNLTGIF